MSNTTKGIITVLIVGGVVYASYKLFFSNKKKIYADLIVSKGKHSNYNDLITFGEDYLKQWYLAAKKGESTFQLNGVNYYTQGGKQVK